MPQPTVLVARHRAGRSAALNFAGSTMWQARPLRSPGSGWTYAHVKRCSRKRANQLRNRLQQRGGSGRKSRGARA